MKTLGEMVDQLATQTNVLIDQKYKLDKTIEINDMQLDSRLLNENDIFCALPGGLQHGIDFVEQAIEKKVAAIISQADEKTKAYVEQDDAHAVPIIQVENLHEILPMFSAWFFDYPASKLKLSGVTGTNGKTSVTQFMAKALNQLGQRCAVVGTLGYGFPDQLTSYSKYQSPTTPDVINLQRIMAHLVAKPFEATHVAMEVTSHALDQHRVAALEFDCAVLTNVTRDHLDYHASFEDYRNAKLKLFQKNGLHKAIINLDDPSALNFIQALDASVDCLTYSTRQTQADIYSNEIHYLKSGIQAKVITPWGKLNIESPLLGEFNLSNLLATIAFLGVNQVSITDIQLVVSNMTGVPGRMQQLVYANQPMIVIDYAHTPHALESALSAAKLHCKGKLWCVFGCGGNRDAGKRPQMGSIAEKIADHLVLTNDNPRFEAPEKIVSDILAGVLDKNSIVIELDRSRAIFYAIENAAIDDVILIAGKGHEDYQEIQGERKPYSDQFAVASFMTEKNGGEMTC